MYDVNDKVLMIYQVNKLQMLINSRYIFTTERHATPSCQGALPPDSCLL